MTFRQSQKRNRTPVLPQIVSLIMSGTHLKRKALISTFVKNDPQDTVWINVCFTLKATRFPSQLGNDKIFCSCRRTSAISSGCNTITWQQQINVVPREFQSRQCSSLLLVTKIPFWLISLIIIVMPGHSPPYSSSFFYVFPPWYSSPSNQPLISQEIPTWSSSCPALSPSSP